MADPTPDVGDPVARDLAVLDAVMTTALNLGSLDAAEKAIVAAWNEMVDSRRLGLPTELALRRAQAAAERAVSRVLGPD